MLRHEGEHSSSGETRIINKINQVNEHIQIPYTDKVADVSVAMQRQERQEAEHSAGRPNVAPGRGSSQWSSPREGNNKEFEVGVRVECAEDVK